MGAPGKSTVAPSPPRGAGGGKGGGGEGARGWKCGMEVTRCGSGSPVWSPGLRSPIPSKAPATSVSPRVAASEGGRKVAPRPRAPPPPRLPPDSRAPAPFPPSPPSARAPFRRPGARRLARLCKLGAASRGPLARNLGAMGGTAGASQAGSWSLGACPGCVMPSAGGGTVQVWRVPHGDRGRTCRSAWSQDCSVPGGGERLRRLPAALGTRSEAVV